MTRVSTPFVAAIALLAVICAQPAAADTIDIDLNDFYADATVTVAVDGSTATMAEDSVTSPVLLSNYPDLGDDEVIFGGAGYSLLFDYAFVEGAGEDDEFTVFLLDGDTGFGISAAHEITLDASGSGSVDWDLSSFGSDTLGLQFELWAGFSDSGLTSTVTISNVQLVTPGSPVPEPATVTLMSAALAGFVAHRRRKRFAA